jgi:hypothetical protein
VSTLHFTPCVLLAYSPCSAILQFATHCSIRRKSFDVELLVWLGTWVDSFVTYSVLTVHGFYGTLAFCYFLSLCHLLPLMERIDKARLYAKVSLGALAQGWLGHPFLTFIQDRPNRSKFRHYEWWNTLFLCNSPRSALLTVPTSTLDNTSRSAQNSGLVYYLASWPFTLLDINNREA